MPAIAIRVVQWGNLMSRTFMYVRVSTPDQSPANQVREVETAGFTVSERRLVVECISGSVAVHERSGFSKLMDRMESGSSLIVTQLDDLGRNLTDFLSTIERLASKDIGVHCLALGVMDLTSPVGKMAMGILAAVAKFEKDMLVERTLTAQSRAREKGLRIGRPEALSAEKREAVLAQLSAGTSVPMLAKTFNTSRQTIMRIRDRARAAGTLRR